MSIRRRSKYNARKREIDGHVFDSLAEASRYGELRLLERAGEISGLRLQPRYRLQGAFTDDYGRRHRAVDYYGDFEYTENGRQICEDVKGGKATQTPVYRLKLKLAAKRYRHIEFREVER